MTSINPYAAPASTIHDVDDPPPNDDGRYRDDPSGDRLDRPNMSLLGTVGVWAVVCSFAAGPSFFFGMQISGDRYGAMIAGVVTYIAMYTMLDFRTRDKPWRRDRMIRRTLRITYTSRMVLSVIFPAAMFVDVFCGMVSVPLGSMLTAFIEARPDLQFDDRIGRGMTMPTTFVVTLIQGLLCHAVLIVYGIVCYGLVRWLASRKAKSET